MVAIFQTLFTSFFVVNIGGKCPGFELSGWELFGVNTENSNARITQICIIFLFGHGYNMLHSMNYFVL